MVVLHVLQLHLMDETVIWILVVREYEVQDSYRIDILQMVVPGAYGSLLTDGEGGIVDTAVLEERLLGLLHLDNHLTPVGQLAIHVVDSLSVCIAVAKMLVVQIGEVGDFLLTFEEGIEETNQQVLVQFCAEQFLKSEVCVRVNVLLADAYFHFLLSPIFLVVFYHSS